MLSNYEKYGSKEGIIAEIIRSFTKVQPVNIIPAVDNLMEKKHLMEQDNFVTYENFASLLAKKGKKTVKKVTVKDVKEVKEVKEEQTQTSMERMKYYNHDAKEIYFYTRMSTTDIKG